jgi:tetratricopeptide (TPR) repeat protein
MPEVSSDPAPSSRAEPRLDGLDSAGRGHLQSAACALRDGNEAATRVELDALLARHPAHPEALRVYALLHARAQRPAPAFALLQRVLAQWPDYAMAWSDLGNLQRAVGDIDAALDSWQRACAFAPGVPMPWFNLGRHRQLCGDTVAAISALERAHALAPDLLPAAILLGDALVHAGRLDDATARYRHALAVHPACGDAWRGLANIKTRPLSVADREQLTALLQRADLRAEDRVAMGFALGKACEDQHLYDQAFAALTAANAQLRERAPWRADLFHAHVEAMRATCSRLPPATESTRGDEVIFIVGLPRSGSTLFEQILAAHPQVEGASELNDLEDVLGAESARRQQPLLQWLPRASAADWQRLGDDYLARTARWRQRTPRHTDKLPSNWLLAGIIGAMLPGAHIVDIRRDAVETGWSCFKQQFYRLPHFSCALADIGAYTRDHDRAVGAWQAERPQRLRVQYYEALLADAEQETRALLAFCDLPFAPECLDFRHATRAVRTASAAQVRQPLQHDTARAGRYGALLDPLRVALGLPSATVP